MAEVSVVIPTLGRSRMLTRVLDRLARQTADPGRFEVVVVTDPEEPEPDGVARAVVGRPFAARAVQRHAPGVSAARNHGWTGAAAPVVLFLDDDVLPDARLVSGASRLAPAHPEETV